MKDLKKQVTKIAQDLLNLEVNTIIKPNISGEKMRTPRHALIDIAKWYSRKLADLGFPLRDESIRLGDYRSFDALRERAHDGIREKAAAKSLTPDEEADLLMLHRIKDMSDQIKEVFNALETRAFKAWDNSYTHEQIARERPSFPLTPDELVLIRKVWEMGVEEIALQTVIQLDGDVMTRVNPKYTTGESKVVHEIHNQGVSVSLRFWKELIGVMKDFFETILKMFR